MHLKFCFFLTCLVFFSIGTWAQEADTVYIHEDPLIIRKQVVVEIPSEKPQSNLKNWFIVLGYAYGRYTSQQAKDSIQKTLAPIHIPCLAVGKAFKNWSLSIGIGQSSSKLSLQSSKQFSKTTEIWQVRYDTAGSHVVNTPNGPKTIYFIDTVAYPSTEVHKYDSTLYANKSISYLNIPIQIAYKIAYKKVYAQPLLGLGLHFGTWSSLLLADKKVTIPKNYLSGTVGIELGVQISKKIFGELGVTTTRQITQRQAYLGLHQTSGRLHLKYVF